MKCRHDACTCAVEEEGYCSEACRNAGPLPAGMCECGHEECGAVVPMDEREPGVFAPEA